MKPTFLDYDQARAWIEQKAKEYGGMKPFSASPEYHAIAPEVQALYKRDNQARSELALTKAGLAYGDTVEWSQMNLLQGGVVTCRGILVERKSRPYVKLTPPMMGRTEVRWHPGFEKTTYSYDRS